MFETMQQLLKAIDAFRSPPTILHQIIELTDSPMTPVYRVADTIATDPALAARVLRQSNSAFYGRSRAVASLREAVVMLGFHAIRSIVITSAMQNFFRGRRAVNRLVPALWEHSIAAAIYARLLAQKNRGINPEEAYLAALMHDLGKLVLSEFLGEKYVVLSQESYKSASVLLSKEKQLVGTSHPEVGKFLLDKWLFPKHLVDSIARHHESDSELDELSYMISLANRCVTVFGYNVHPPFVVDQDILNGLAFYEAQNDFEQLMQEQLSLFGSINP